MLGNIIRIRLTNGERRIQRGGIRYIKRQLIKWLINKYMETFAIILTFILGILIGISINLRFNK